MRALHYFWAQDRTPVAARLLLGVSRGYCSGHCGAAEMPLWARAFKIKIYFLFTSFSWPRWPRAEWPGSHVLKMESTTLGTEPSAKRSSCPGWLPIPDSDTRNNLGHLVKAVEPIFFNAGKFESYILRGLYLNWKHIFWVLVILWALCEAPRV